LTPGTGAGRKENAKGYKKTGFTDDIGRKGRFMFGPGFLASEKY